MRPLMYILDSHGAPTPCDDALQFGRWFSVPDNRHVALTYVKDGGFQRVQTAFLGIDPDEPGSATPRLWGTAVFGGPHDEYEELFATRAEAIEAHLRIVANLVAGREPSA